VKFFSSPKKEKIYLRAGCLQVQCNLASQYGRVNFQTQIEIFAIAIGGPTTGGAPNISVWFDESDAGPYIPPNQPYNVESVINNAALTQCFTSLRFPTPVNNSITWEFPYPICTRSISAGSTQSSVSFFVNFLYREFDPN
jgi:hypothetical protein